MSVLNETGQYLNSTETVRGLFKATGKVKRKPFLQKKLKLLKR